MHAVRHPSLLCRVSSTCAPFTGMFIEVPPSMLLRRVDCTQAEPCLIPSRSFLQRVEEWVKTERRPRSRRSHAPRPRSASSVSCRVASIFQIDPHVRPAHSRTRTVRIWRQLPRGSWNVTFGVCSNHAAAMSSAHRPSSWIEPTARTLPAPVRPFSSHRAER
jgi:hypothetical protein